MAVSEALQEAPRAVTPVSEQIRLLALARWQAFRNSLRRKQKQAELVFKILFWLSSLSAVVFGGLAFFSATYFLFPKKPTMLVAVFWILFATWQIVPLLLEGQSPALDFREIARYPIPFRLFFSLSAAYGLLDPAAVIAIAWGVCGWFGVLLAAPRSAPRFALAFALFIPLNLFMNRVIFGWVSRINQTRSGRERMMAVTLFLIVGMQFVFWLLPTQAESHPWVPKLILAIGKSLPPAWFTDIALAPRDTALRAAAAAIITAMLFAALFFRHCRRTFAGETAGEGSRRSGAVQVAPGWDIPLLSGPVAAAMEKEIRYILKDPRIFTNLLMVWGFAFVSSFSGGMLRDAFHINADTASVKLYPAMIGYSLLVINMLCFNIFGADPPGFQRWLLSPLPLRSVLVAKNLSFACIVVVDVAVITSIYRLRGPLPAALLARTMLGVGYATLAMVALGNVLSAWFPKKIVPGKLSGKNVSEAGVIIALVFMGAIGGSWAAVNTLAVRRQIAWLPYFAFAVFVVLAAALYVLSLRVTPSYIAKRLDNMLAELG